MWPDLIQKAKDGGVDVIQTYVFWNGHEPSPGNVMNYIYFQFIRVFFNFYIIYFVFFTNSCFIKMLNFFSITLKIGLTWLSLSRWFNKLAFMLTCVLVPTFALNGTLGNTPSVTKYKQNSVNKS